MAGKGEMSTSSAVETTIAALKAAGKVDEAGVDAALVALVRSLAAAVDATPDNASLWREFRAAEMTLRTLNAATDVDALAGLLAGLSAPVGDAAQPAPRDARGKARQGRRDAGAAADAVAAPRGGRRPRDRS